MHDGSHIEGVRDYHWLPSGWLQDRQNDVTDEQVYKVGHLTGQPLVQSESGLF